jgi:hypothetical protein
MIIVRVENGNSRRETSPSAILPTTDLTLICQESNKDFCGDRPATNRLKLEGYNESKSYLKNYKRQLLSTTKFSCLCENQAKHLSTIKTQISMFLFV